MNNGHHIIKLALMHLLPIFYYTSSLAAQLTEQNFIDELPTVLTVAQLKQPLPESVFAVTSIDQYIYVSTRSVGDNAQ